eukprot:g4824.t1
MNWSTLTLHGMECIIGLEKVENLDLTNCLSITDRFLQCFNRAKSTIKYLCLNGCVRITDEGIHHLSSLMELVELRVSHLPSVTGRNLTQLSSKLELLDASHCENLSDESVRCYINSHHGGIVSNLSYLDLSGCQNIQSSTLASFSDLNQLKRLKLSGLYQLVEINQWNQLAKLKALDISFASRLIMHQALPVIAQMTQLRSLRLAGCPLLQGGGGGGNLNPELLKDLKSLRCLDLAQCTNLQFGLHLADVLENLEVLNLADGRGCIHSRNNEYFKNASKLKVLGLSGYAYIPMNVIRGLSTVSSLEVLNLSGLGNLNDRMVKEISQLTLLTYLDLSQNGVHCKVTMYGARYLRSLSLLKSLKICGWSETSANGFLVLRHLKNLTSLDMSNCLKLTDKGLKALSSSSARSLVELNIVNCFQVTTGGLKALRKCIVLETLYLSHHIKGDIKSEIPRVGNIQFISPIDYVFDSSGNNNSHRAYFQHLLETLSKEEKEDAPTSTLR